MNALVTMAISDEYKAIGALTFPLLKAYADKYGLDYYNIDTPRASPKHACPAWERFALYELLEKYDRIIHAEVDVIVSPTARDILGLLPPGVFYSLDEYAFDPLQAEPCWVAAMEAWGDEFPMSRDYPKFLYNSGLCIVDKLHREMFAPARWETDHGMIEMAMMNMRLHKHGWAHQDVRPDYLNASHCGLRSNRDQTSCMSCGRTGQKWTA
jgi:hypothetical protein